MSIIKVFMWIAVYFILATILFNLFRYGIKFNLPSSLILSASISFLMSRIHISESMGDFLTDYIYAIIILAGIVTFILVIGRDTHDSKDNINNQQKTWTMVFHIKKR